MVQIRTRVTGVEPAGKVLVELQTNARALGSFHVFVGSRDPRAKWFERGFHPRGGSTLVPGRHMLERAAQGADSKLRQAVTAAFEGGGHGAVLEAMVKIGHEIAAAAGAGAPNRTGRLRGAYTVQGKA